MMPLSFSISDGIAFGFISYVFLKLATRQWHRIPWPLFTAPRSLRRNWAPPNLFTPPRVKDLNATLLLFHSCPPFLDYVRSDPLGLCNGSFLCDAA